MIGLTSISTKPPTDGNKRKQSLPRRQSTDVRPVKSADNLAVEIRHALSNSGYLYLRTLRVFVRGDLVTLRGTVATNRLKEIAEGIVQGVDGVREVQNELDVICAGLAPTQHGSGSNSTSGAASALRFQTSSTTRANVPIGQIDFRREQER